MHAMPIWVICLKLIKTLLQNLGEIIGGLHVIFDDQRKRKIIIDHFLQAFDMAFETTNFPTVQGATISGFRAWVIIFGQCVNIKTAPINR